MSNIEDFCDKRCTTIQEEKFKEEIMESIKEIGTYSFDGKYSHYLNKKNMDIVKGNDYKIGVSTYGKKYNLYLKNIRGKNYSFFMNRKTKQIILGKLTFTLPLFQGTLFDGELIKNSRNEWFFLINDLIYYEGKSVVTEKWDERNNKLNKLIKEQYKHDEKSHCKIILKDYVSIKYIESFVNHYIPLLSYKSSGIVFKNIFNFSNNFMFMFPDSRTDIERVDKNKKSYVKVEKVKNVEEEKVEEEDFLSMLGNECEVCDYENVEEEKVEEEVLSKDTHCRFIVKNTTLPDIYELYCRSSSGKVEKHSIACIPSMASSTMMKKMFEDNTQKVMKCRYHCHFKKWEPYELHHNNNIDSLSRINYVKNHIDKTEEEDEI